MPEEVNLICRIKPYIQPFERKLALLELEQLTNAKAYQYRDDPNCFVVNTSVSSDYPLGKLAYWESIKDTKVSWTKQLKREATTRLIRNGINPWELINLLPFTNDIPIPNRRCLRYGPHNIHEYRGKFFPQLVRVLMNLSSLPSNSMVLDPMCGSGTTLVEANLAGYKTIGIDSNPLSIFIAKTKCEILHASPVSIINDYDRVKSSLSDPKVQQSSDLTYFRTLAQNDQYYLESWFAPHVLSDLDLIATLLNKMPQSVCKDLFWLCLSDILRSVSYQKTDDLRVRRELKDDEDVDAISVYLSRLGRTVRHVVTFLLGETQINLNRFEVLRGDARELRIALADLKESPDVVITSPPYATALPYLDTDRLSLSYLKLLPRQEHRTTDYQMIGNREISEKQRLNLWDIYMSQEQNLPLEIRNLITEVDQAYRNTDVGFRRKNLPALLAKYFLDMKKVLQEINQVVKNGGHVFIIVGDNHTVAHGRRIDIDTAKMIGLLGESIGMQLLESIPMDMLTPRGIFKRNSIASEHIVHARVCR